MTRPEDPIGDAVDALVRRLRSARRVGVLTGAGMSADSGLPTYRGIGGLYNDMEVEEGMPIEEILHAYTFARNPALTWKYLARIERACRGAGPNEGHRILSRWEQRFDVCVVTQNVDGLHREAGSSSVIELHGTLRRLFCIDCERDLGVDDFDDLPLPPRCGACDGLVRPDVVLFGEGLPREAVSAYEAELERGFDVLFVIGTTAAFPYIHDPVVEAASRGVTTVEINPDETPLSRVVTHRLRAGAMDALRTIARRLEEA